MPCCVRPGKSGFETGGASIPGNIIRSRSGTVSRLLLERCLVSPSAVVVHRRLFDLVGLFDESLPACEDYDLWLRIGWRFPIGLVEKPFVIKRGGHPDQLSATIANLDKYRIKAILKLIGTAALDPAQRKAAERILEKKRRIYCDGCRKRGNISEAQRVDAFVREELLRVRSRN